MLYFKSQSTSSKVSDQTSLCPKAADLNNKVDALLDGALKATYGSTLSEDRLRLEMANDIVRKHCPHVTYEETLINTQASPIASLITSPSKKQNPVY